jgi:lipopolysaccharide transport system ATP-binding protein
LLNFSQKKLYQEFHALKNISFSVEKGQTLGIIGHNGSGKTTLLKMICGVIQPTSGNIQVNGRISSLLELGAGFNPEFTGRENVFMNGALVGISREELEHRLPEIERFAEIGEYINQPVKTYSSGMYVRLAFSCAINIDPEILVIDEALSVGDMLFQMKCNAKIKAMIEKGLTFLIVSHDVRVIKSLCEKCVLLSNGEMLEYGPSYRIVEDYVGSIIKTQQRVMDNSIIGSPLPGSKRNVTEKKDMQGNLSPDFKFQERINFQRIQNGMAEFKNIQLLNENEEEISSVEYDQKVILRYKIEVYEDISLLVFGYNIRDKNGVDLVYSDSNIENKSLEYPKKRETFIIDWKFQIPLVHGLYSIACVLSIPTEKGSGLVEFCDFIPYAVQFSVMPREGACLYGGVHWENNIEVKELKADI